MEASRKCEASRQRTYLELGTVALMFNKKRNCVICTPYCCTVISAAAKDAQSGVSASILFKVRGMQHYGKAETQRRKATKICLCWCRTK
jgi:hypothetical protein